MEEVVFAGPGGVGLEGSLAEGAEVALVLEGLNEGAFGNDMNGGYFYHAPR